MSGSGMTFAGIYSAFIHEAAKKNPVTEKKQDFAAEGFLTSHPRQAGSETPALPFPGRTT